MIKSMKKYINKFTLALTGMFFATVSRAAEGDINIDTAALESGLTTIKEQLGTFISTAVPIVLGVAALGITIYLIPKAIGVVKKAFKL